MPKLTEPGEKLPDGTDLGAIRLNLRPSEAIFLVISAQNSSRSGPLPGEIQFFQQAAPF